MCQEKKEDENLPTLKIAQMHQYRDSYTTLKRAKKDLIAMASSSTDMRTNRTIIAKKQKLERQL